MYISGLRKLENPKRIQGDTIRTCKLHTERFGMEYIYYRLQFPPVAKLRTAVESSLFLFGLVLVHMPSECRAANFELILYV